MPDSRTPAPRTRPDCAAYRVRKVSSPPMPRSTRSPATVSAPSEVSSPASCRWAAWRRCSGRMTRVSDASSTGPPTSMMTPSTHRAVQQDDRHDEEADDGPGHPGGDVVGVADPPEVAGEAGDDLAGRHLPGEGRPGPPHRALGDHGGAERRDEPVAHGEPVPAVGRDGAEQAQAHDRAGPHEQGLLVVRDEPVDGLADRRRDEGDGQHPRHAEQHAPQDGSPLAPSEPHEVAVGVQRRGLVRVDRVGPVVVRHQSSTLSAAGTGASDRVSRRPTGVRRASGGSSCQSSPTAMSPDSRTRRIEPAAVVHRPRRPGPDRVVHDAGTAAPVARPRAARPRPAPASRAASRRRRGSA